MSTLTKVFIVLMVIFSIAFTMSSISFVAKTEDWKSLAQDYQQEQLIVETNMRQLAAAHAAEKTVWIDTRKAMEDQIGDLDAALQRQTAELTDLRDEVARLRGEKSDSEALSSRLASELQVAMSGWVEQKTQREQVELRNEELERRNQDLNERVSEQSAQIVVLVQQLNQAEQQINILREQSGGMGSGGMSSGGARFAEPIARTGVRGVTPAAAPALTPIRGKIVEVNNNLATISVGSADGVQSGMVFVIYRGSDYVGDVQVTEVQPNLSAGRVVRARTTPRVNDMVADEPALGFAK